MLRNGKHIEKANSNHITKYIDNINSRFNVNLYYLSYKIYPRFIAIELIIVFITLIKMPKNARAKPGPFR